MSRGNLGMDAMTIVLSEAKERQPVLGQPGSATTGKTALRMPARGGRVLVVVRWPVGGIRTHILYNYPTLARAGYRFTFVGPADGSLRTLQDSLADLGGLECV